MLEDQKARAITIDKAAKLPPEELEGRIVTGVLHRDDEAAPSSARATRRWSSGCAGRCPKGREAAHERRSSSRCDRASLCRARLPRGAVRGQRRPGCDPDGGDPGDGGDPRRAPRGPDPELRARRPGAATAGPTSSSPTTPSTTPNSSASTCWWRSPTRPPTTTSSCCAPTACSSSTPSRCRDPPVVRGPSYGVPFTRLALRGDRARPDRQHPDAGGRGRADRHRHAGVAGEGGASAWCRPAPRN